MKNGRRQPNVNSVYMDHAATTPLAPEVLEAMLPYLTDHFGNPSSTHHIGRVAKGAIEESRERIAQHLEVKPEHIIFTSGTTEANNLALNVLDVQDHLITSTIEHKSILEPAREIEKYGLFVTSLSPQLKTGAVHSDQIGNSITLGPDLVSLNYVNNETGAINPIAEIGEEYEGYDDDIILHTDAAQAAAWFSLSVVDLHVDMMSLSAHKIYGPKGIGILYVNDKNVEFIPQLFGGGQERGRRGGTENVAGAVGMAAAMDLIAEDRDEYAQDTLVLRTKLQEMLLESLEDQMVVNTPSKAAPHILNIAFPPRDHVPLDGEMLLLNLDLEGICASSGAACASGALEPSHVLLEMGLPEDTARASLRLSLGRYTTLEDVETTAQAIIKVVKRMRGNRQDAG
ncbi:MAG: cysteine desulfurase family protein [Bacteroidetes bacterium]|nr:cysteine desulfurase family protein [Bacteroidota bacterium]